jgi:hypothetical protein
MHQTSFRIPVTYSWPLVQDVALTEFNTDKVPHCVMLPDSRMQDNEVETNFSISNTVFAIWIIFSSSSILCCTGCSADDTLGNELPSYSWQWIVLNTFWSEIPCCGNYWWYCSTAEVMCPLKEPYTNCISIYFPFQNINGMAIVTFNNEVTVWYNAQSDVLCASQSLNSEQASVWTYPYLLTHVHWNYKRKFL